MRLVLCRTDLGLPYIVPETRTRSERRGNTFEPKAPSRMSTHSKSSRTPISPPCSNWPPVTYVLFPFTHSLPSCSAILLAFESYLPGHNGLTHRTRSGMRSMTALFTKSPPYFHLSRSSHMRISKSIVSPTGSPFPRSIPTRSGSAPAP